MGGDITSELLSQIPKPLIAQVCISGIFIVVAFVYFAYIKPNRKKAREKATQTTLNPPESRFNLYNEPTYPASVPDENIGDLPDLEMLVMHDTQHPETPHLPQPQEKVKTPPRKAPAGVYRVQLYNGSTSLVREVISILRDEDDGRLMIQIEGKAYRSLTDVPDTKKQFARIMKELSETVTQPDSRSLQGDMEELETARSSIEETPPTLGDLIQTSELDLDMPDIADLAATDESVTPPKTRISLNPSPPPVSPMGDMPGDLPSFKLDDNKPRVKQEGGLFRRKTKVEFDPVPEINIGMAVETYLQYKLRHSSEYAGRNFHIHNTPAGGVRIQIDDRFYEAVDEIEAVDIRDFIQTAILEWHQRQ